MAQFLLGPEQAAILAGAPAEQLKRWAWLSVGPRNSGTKYKPKYLQEDIEAWRFPQNRGKSDGQV